MKKVLLVYIFISISNIAFGQFGKTDISFYKNFENQKLIVVLSEDDKFLQINKDLKDAVRQYWNYTTYEFINASEEKKYKTQRNVIFFKIEFTQPNNQYRATSGLLQVYTYALRLYKYKLSKKGKVKKRILLASNRMETLDAQYESASGDITVKDKAPLTSKAELTQAVKGIVRFCDYVFEKQMTKNISFGKYLKEISKQRKSDISEKKLLLPKYKLKKAIITEDKVKEIYPYDFQIVNSDIVSDAIINDEKGLMRVKFVRTNQSFYILIVDVADEKILYGRVAPGLNQVKLGPKILKELKL